MRSGVFHILPSAGRRGRSWPGLATHQPGHYLRQATPDILQALAENVFTPARWIVDVAHLARELAQDEHAPIIGARRRVLVRDEIHAVSQWCHERGIRRSIVCEEGTTTQISVEVVNRHSTRIGIAAVDVEWLDPAGGCVPEPEICDNEIDDDCDGDIDAADSDCGGATCGVPGDTCSSGADCCSGLCHPKKLTCK